MKAIVTGASGFIGSKIVDELIREGFKVAALGRRSFNFLPSFRKNLLKDSIYIKSNLYDIDKTIEDLKLNGFSDSNFFFHFAWGGETQLSDLDVEAQNKNIETTINTYELAKKLNCKRYIFCGTMEESFAELYTQLDYHTEKKFNRHVVYALAKISARESLKLIYDKEGPEILFGTNSHVMGLCDDKNSFLQVVLFNILNDKNINMTSGEQNFDVINVIDCAKAYISIAKYGISGFSYWVGSGYPKKLKEYVEAIRKIFHKSTSQVEYNFLTYNDVFLDKKVFSIDSLKKDTGFSPKISFDDSVKELATFLKNRKLI